MPHSRKYRIVRYDEPPKGVPPLPPLLMPQARTTPQAAWRIARALQNAATSWGFSQFKYRVEREDTLPDDIVGGSGE